MYTSCQPCQMCTGAIVRSGLGRVVYALSTEQLVSLNPASGWPTVAQEGPALFGEARIPIEHGIAGNTRLIPEAGDDGSGVAAAAAGRGCPRPVSHLLADDGPLRRCAAAS
jgi:hypothetical protein